MDDLAGGFSDILEEISSSILHEAKESLSLVAGGLEGRGNTTATAAAVCGGLCCFTRGRREVGGERRSRRKEKGGGRKEKERREGQGRREKGEREEGGRKDGERKREGEGIGRGGEREKGGRRREQRKRKVK